MCCLLILLLVDIISYIHVKTEITVSPRLLLTWRLTVTTGRGSLVLLDKNYHQISVHGVIALNFILNVIGQYMIELVHLIAFIKLHSFFLFSANRYGVIKINARAIAARGYTFI